MEPYPQGESYHDVVKRIRAFLDDVFQPRSDLALLVIAHRATHHAIEHLLSGTSLEELVSGPWTWQPGWQYVLK